MTKAASKSDPAPEYKEVEFDPYEEGYELRRVNGGGWLMTKRDATDYSTQRNKSTKAFSSLHEMLDEIVALEDDPNSRLLTKKVKVDE